MKKLLCCVLLSAIALFAADLTGNWKGKATREEPQYNRVLSDDMSLQLTQNGTQVTGTVSFGKNTQAIQNGTIQNGKISFISVSGPDKASFQLQLSPAGDRIQGTVTPVGGAARKVDLARVP